MISPLILIVILSSMISLSMLIQPSMTAASAFPSQHFEFGPLNHIYNLTIGNQSYRIRYGFTSDENAQVKNMTADYGSKLIKVVIDDNSTTNEKRFFMIELLRNVINSNTTEITGGCAAAYSPGTPPSWVQEHDLDYNIVVSQLDSEGVAVYNGSQGEECGREARTLSIEYLDGKSTIVIQGNTMIPEFGLSLSALVTAIALAGAIGISIAVRRRI